MYRDSAASTGRREVRIKSARGTLLPMISRTGSCPPDAHLTTGAAIFRRPMIFGPPRATISAYTGSSFVLAVNLQLETCPRAASEASSGTPPEACCAAPPAIYSSRPRTRRGRLLGYDVVSFCVEPARSAGDLKVPDVVCLSDEEFESHVPGSKKATGGRGPSRCRAPSGRSASRMPLRTTGKAPCRLSIQSGSRRRMLVSSRDSLAGYYAPRHSR